MNPGNSLFTSDFFDEASTAWRANKIMKANATYSYRCRSVLKSGKACPLAAMPLELTCKRHSKTLELSALVSKRREPSAALVSKREPSALVGIIEPSALVGKLEPSALVSKLEPSALVSKLEPGPSLRHFKDIPTFEKDSQLTLSKA